jgi:hypothetical protein
MFDQGKEVYGQESSHSAQECLPSSLLFRLLTDYGNENQEGRTFHQKSKDRISHSSMLHRQGKKQGIKHFKEARYNDEQSDTQDTPGDNPAGSYEKESHPCHDRTGNESSTASQSHAQGSLGQSPYSSEHNHDAKIRFGNFLVHHFLLSLSRVILLVIKNNERIIIFLFSFGNIFCLFISLIV